MKRTRIVWLLAAPILTVAVMGQSTQSAAAPTVAATVDGEIGGVEKQVAEAAEAMPEESFNFSPESLHIPGAHYEGVRTFALQVKHVAASNYAIWSVLTGETFPKDFLGGDGPENLKSKAEILRFLKDSFALGHRAAATLTAGNMLEHIGSGGWLRLSRAEFGVSHAFDHYGQMVEYLRMNGIVPPASVPGGPKSEAPGAVRSRAEETLEWWNHVGNKLIAMAKDFPEEKYDFRAQMDERTFAQNLLHVAAVDFDLAGQVSGSTVGPDFGKEKHNPSQDVYKTKADVVKLLEQAVAAGAAVIDQQGDAGLDRTMPFGWETGRHGVHASYIWMTGIEHSTEHFGQLVVYYRANGLVPPESRPR